MSIYSSWVRPSARFPIRSTIWIPLLAAVVFTSIYLPLASRLVQANTTASSVAAATPIQHTPQSTPVPAVTPCIPSTFSTPSHVNLENADTGLTIERDPVTTYQIYGESAAGLRAQIQHCAPGANSTTAAEFTAQTSYNLDWQYNTVMLGDSCTLAAIKVGVHTATALPAWQPDAAATVGLPTRWQTFIQNLTVHEQGHATLDMAYAARIVSQLRSVGTVPCTNVADTVSSLVHSTIAALNQANDDYDTQTDHGTTQGAVIPNY
jgi:predicted secreted Zn-dependent protease